MKSASGNRPPDEAHATAVHLWNPIENHEKRFGQASSGQDTQCPGKEAIQPHQLCLREPRKGSAHWHAALPAEGGTTLIQKMKCLRRGEWRPEGAKSTLLYKYETLVHRSVSIKLSTKKVDFVKHFTLLK